MCDVNNMVFGLCKLNIILFHTYGLNDLIVCFCGVVGREPAISDQKLVRGAWVRTPPTTAHGHDIAGDVERALNFFQLGMRPQGK